MSLVGGEEAAVDVVHVEDGHQLGHLLGPQQLHGRLLVQLPRQRVAELVHPRRRGPEPQRARPVEADLLPCLRRDLGSRYCRW